MFSLSQSDELVFQIHCPFPEQQGTILTQQDLVTDQASTVPTIINNLKRHRNNSSLSIGDYIKDESTGNGNKQKKLMHREIERLRRQEMSKLYRSLRSLLPPEFIKGKRSISDHLQQAVSYINQLQGRIKDLNIKKNKLDDKRVISPGDGCSNNFLAIINNINVIVTPCCCGVEILIISGLMEEGFPLSRVMEVLLEEGLNVISCASTRVNERLLHTIKSEASNPTCIDISGLQQKLSDVIRG